MNFARIFALLSRYTRLVLCAAGIGVLGVALTPPSAAEAAQASKASNPVAKKATNKHVKKTGKPMLRRVAKTSPKKSRLAAIKPKKEQVARQTPRRATQETRIAMPRVAVLQVANILPGAVHQNPAFRTVSLNNSVPQMAAQYPDEAYASRKATTACLLNGEVFLLADCNTEPDSHFGIGRETTAVSPVGHRPLPASPGAGLPTESADVPPPEPS
ncbi:MAG: hypothetical protein NTY05_03175 [Rhodocyclales bacterium]|nr:hypothetical protein [Rhodocyclales bacterium]